MPKRSRNKLDFNQIARRIVDQATSEPEVEPAEKKKLGKQKDPAAVALGRKGGLKGGKARAAKMTKAQLSASAKKAALSRWKKNAESAN